MPTQFQLISKFQPQGDQPEAIRQLMDGLKRGIPNPGCLPKPFALAGKSLHIYVMHPHEVYFDGERRSR